MVGKEGKEVVEHEVGVTRVSAHLFIIFDKVDDLAGVELGLIKGTEGGGSIRVGCRLCPRRERDSLDWLGGAC